MAYTSSTHPNTEDHPIYKECPISEGQIRLLYLHPLRNWQKALFTGLKVFTLEDVPPFYAVSYEWGNTNSRKFIYVDGHEVGIGENLYHFLTLAKWGERIITTPLWVDALCINQHNGDEKAKQVQMMGKIYKAAHAVIMWVGKDLDGSKLLFKLLNVAYNQVYKGPEQNLSIWDIVKMNFQFTFMSERQIYPLLQIRYQAKRQNWSLTRSIAQFCNRTYWTRTWVLQECLLAKSLIVCCGRQWVPWWFLNDSLNKGLRLVSPLARPLLGSNTEYSVSDSWAYFSDQVEKKYFGTGSFFTANWHSWYQRFVDLMEHVEQTQCQELRDKIYSVMSLVVLDYRQKRIEADYSIEIELVFLQILSCWGINDITVKLANICQTVLEVNISRVLQVSQRMKTMKTTELSKFSGIKLDTIKLGTITQLNSKRGPTNSDSFNTTFMVTFGDDCSVYLDEDDFDIGSRSKRKSYTAIGVPSCPLELNDIIFAFLDTAACVIFRRMGKEFLSIGTAIFVDNDLVSTEMWETGVRNGFDMNLLEDNSLIGIEIEKFEGSTEIETEPWTAAAILAWSNKSIAWPRNRRIRSQWNMEPYL